MSSRTSARRRGAAPVSVAQYRPATKKRRFRHDAPIALDLFAGFGGMTEGLKRAGFEVIYAANHNPYKVEVHEANHPTTEHWIADLVDTEAPNYHSVRDLPRADVVVAGVSCTNHASCNTKRAYAEGLALFELDDPEYDARVTRSEKDRATATCVLQYAAQHRPLMLLIECTTEFVSWGEALPGKQKIGDGSTYRWWLGEWTKLDYDHQVCYLNTRFFGVPQSRDRIYIVLWLKHLPAPDLQHRPEVWCGHCEQLVQAVWTWRTGIPPSGVVRYGKQYDYRCPSCRREVVPASSPSINAIDLTNLGTKIGERKRPLVPTTMARAERCRQKFGEFPAVLMPAKAIRGVERHPWQPLATQTGQQETGMLTASAIAVDNFQGAPRGVDEPLGTLVASETMGLLSARVLPNRTHGTSRSLGEPTETIVGSAGAGGLGLLSTGVVPFRRNTLPRVHGEPMPTLTADQIPGLLTAAGRVVCNGSIAEAPYRSYPLDQPISTVVGSAITQGLLFSGWYKQNGSTGSETAPHGLDRPLGTLTSRDTTALLMAEWSASLAQIPLEECYFRMFTAPEIGRGCGFDVDFPGHRGTFVVWGSAREQVDGYGNAVPPQMGNWFGDRMRPVLHGAAA